jgi:excisionase family DNA binding protein
MNFETQEEATMREPQQDRWMTAKEVAAYLRMSAWFVYSHANGHRRPALKSYKFGSSRRFKRSDVDEFTERLRQSQEDWARVQ